METNATLALPLLEVEDLAIVFDTPAGPARAVDGVSWRLDAGQTLGIVGESGCGKSVTAMAILRLLESPPARIVHGAIRYRGRNLLAEEERAMRQLRGNRLAMIFQDPMSSLNPVLSVGRQVAEALVLHQGLTKRQAQAQAVEMLRLVRIAEPKRRAAQYPHELSGGMRQRVMIALALACRPEVLIADEPTTALDVTIQAQILELLKSLQREIGMAIVMITHDLGVVAESCDRVVVMYAGRKVEEGPVADVFRQPLHPYTRALLTSLPSMGANVARLPEIPGMVPPAHASVAGCAFAPRCVAATSRCRAERPVLQRVATDREAACFVARQPVGSLHVQEEVQA